MDVNPNSRRRHSAEFKAQVVAACAEPGATVAAVARAFGLNDNLVHDWRRGRFQDHRNIAARISAGVCCAVTAFIAAAPSTGARAGAGGRSRGDSSRVQAWGDRRKRDVAHLGRCRLRGMAS
jgi:transposase-like protein